MPTIGLSMTIVLGAAEATRARAPTERPAVSRAWLALAGPTPMALERGRTPAGGGVEPRRRNRIWTVPSFKSSAVRS